ncbi:MAG TPA: hypothetical protein VHQ95_21255, partial [Pyrinomonadaceae bacterium]|nr:hypothetical protein [Pyrinomonadaceae bacterium]
VNTLTQSKLGKVVRFRRMREVVSDTKAASSRRTPKIAPSSRHLAVEHLSAQQSDAVNVRQLAS